MTKNLLNKISFAALAAMVALPFVGNSVAHAAADADLTAALASTTAIATDNKNTILGFFVAVGVVVLVLGVGKKGLNWMIAKIVGSVGGRRGRRR